MKVASLILIAASSFCVSLSASAKDTVLLPRQQNNCGNVKVQKATKFNPNTRLDLAAELRQKNANKNSTAKGERPIDLVICLDTSNSMDGLIGSAKEKIWDIVNELATAKPKPHLRVGLYAYGTPSFGSQSGYVHKVVDLSDDLDKVFTELTSLRTNGGDEYCARVISAATKEQKWDDGKSLKILVIAGNEPATLDPQLNVFATAKNAISHGIIINTIYCGSATDPDATDWRKLASSADGQFASIDQNAGTIGISTPFDKKLSELSSAINGTYIAYGKNGYEGRQKQMSADAFSSNLSSYNSASRAVAKISGQYRNSGWDLLDASKEESFDITKLGNDELPSEMKTMNTDQKKSYIAKKAGERSDIQKQIAALSTQRAKYIQDEMKKTGKATDKAFDAAMLKALREQAQKTGFTFDAK